MVAKYTTNRQLEFTEADEEFNPEVCSSQTPIDNSDRVAGKVLPFPSSENFPEEIATESLSERDEEPPVTSQGGIDPLLTSYFTSISKISLLNEKEELTLAKRIKETEHMLISSIIQWDQLFKKDFIKSLPAANLKKIRRNIAQANGAFQLFDDFINLERERKRLYHTDQKLTQGTAAHEELKESLYKVETTLSKNIAQTNLSETAINVIIRQVRNLSNGHRITKNQQQVELELGKTLRRIRHNLDEIRSAKKELVQANLRIVISIAKKYAYHGIPLSDLIQEGNLGLIRATDTYDYRRGHRFITYASWWIKQAVLRIIDCHSRTIRTPVYLREKINTITKASNQLQLKCKRKPTLDEIAKTTNISLEAIEKVTQSFKESLSLDSFIDDNGENTINLSSTHTDNAIVTHLLSSDLTQRINAILSVLSQREQDILKLRFGIRESHNHSLEEIGRKFNLSRERIRQILEEALKKLRNPKSLNTLKDFIQLN